MAFQVLVNGRPTAIPGGYQNRVRLLADNFRSVNQNGIVLLIGEGQGIAEPKVPVLHNSLDTILEEEISGDLFEGARLALDPSEDENVNGATQVITMKVNPATQSTDTVQSSAPADLLDGKTVAYGSNAVGISRKFEAGTLGAFGKKVTISKFGEQDEVIDDVGFQCPAAIAYKGAGTACALTVTPTGLTTAVTGGPGGEDLNLSFSTYQTLDQLQAALAGASAYELVVFAAAPEAVKTSELDYVSAVEIKEETGTITLADGVVVAFTGTMTGLDDQDIVKVGDEYLFVSNATTSTVVRGYGNTVPEAHAAVSATSFYGLSNVNQSIIDEVALRSARVRYTRNSANAVGVPANDTVAQFFTGAVDGTSTNTDWQNALDEAVRVRANFIVLLSDNPTHHGYLKEHMRERWNEGDNEAVAFSGHAKDLNRTALVARNRAINSNNIAMSFQEIQVENAQGTANVWMEPYIDAAINAGLAAGAALTSPIYKLAKRVLDVRQNSSLEINKLSTQERLTVDRLLLTVFKDGFFQLLRDTTCWSGDDDERNTSIAARNAIAFTTYKVRTRVRDKFQPRNVAQAKASAIVADAESVLDEIRDVDGAIVEGSRLVSGQVVEVPAYSNVNMVISGNVGDLNYEAVTNVGLDFIRFNTTIKRFQNVSQ